MAFTIDKEKYDTANGSSNRIFVNKVGDYKVKIEAVKVVTRRTKDKLGMVEAVIIEAPEEGHSVGTKISWSTARADQYNYQERDLKNFSQAALRTQAAEKDLEITKAQLNDPDLPNTLFIDAADFEEKGEEAPESPAVGLIMDIRYDYVTNKRTGESVMVKNKNGDKVKMVRGVW